AGARDLDLDASLRHLLDAMGEILRADLEPEAAAPGRHGPFDFFRRSLLHGSRKANCKTDGRQQRPEAHSVPIFSHVSFLPDRKATALQQQPQITVTPSRIRLRYTGS